MIRLGLCCAFRDAPIRFRTTTAAAMMRLGKAERRQRLSSIILANCEALRAAVQYCADNGIGSFRVNSQILPLKTHPDAGYELHALPESERLVALFQDCGRLAAEHGIRLTFHPDQFVVLNSPRDEVVRSSIEELNYQAEVATWIGADVIMIHGGGAYGDKASAMARLADNIRRVSPAVRGRIALENDDRVFTPRELLPLCESEGIPFVYDVHHHRCLPDDLSVGDVTQRAIRTWTREPLFHISSPAAGWRGGDPRVHAGFIRHRDFPSEWRDLPITVEVEARAKEAAVRRLMLALARRSAISAVSSCGDTR